MTAYDLKLLYLYWLLGGSEVMLFFRKTWIQTSPPRAKLKQELTNNARQIKPWKKDAYRRNGPTPWWWNSRLFLPFFNLWDLFWRFLTRHPFFIRNYFCLQYLTLAWIKGIYTEPANIYVKPTSGLWTSTWKFTSTRPVGSERRLGKIRQLGNLRQPDQWALKVYS